MCADGGGEHCKLELHGYLGDEGVDKVYSCHLTPNSSWIRREEGRKESEGREGTEGEEGMKSYLFTPQYPN